MTPKERLKAVLSGRLADRVPAVPMVAGDHAARISEVPIKRIYEDGKTLGEVLVNAYRHYDLDAVIVFSDVAVEAEAIGAELEFPDEGIPFVINPSTELRVPDPNRDGRMPLIQEATSRCLELLGEEALVFTSIKGPFSVATLISEPEEFFGFLLTDPKAARKKLEFATEAQLRYVDALLDLGDIGIFIGDPFATGELIGPSHFEEFALPYCRRLIEHIHGRGHHAVLHICGETTNLLDQIPKTGAECFSVDEIDLGNAQEKLRGKAALMGNVSTSLLRDGDEQEILGASMSCLEQTAGEPFILSSACDVPMASPEANVRAMVTATRQWNAHGARA